MKQVTLNIKQDKDLDILMPILDRLGITIQEDNLHSKKKLSEEEYLKCLAIIDKGIDVSNYGDPMEWQKEQREDRKLPYRD